MARVLVADPIAKEGVRRLEADHHVDVRTGLKPEALNEIIGAYDALVVRSETQVTAELIAAGERLQVIGRAGVGVDNIDLDAATQRGIAVVNSPTANTAAAAEHAMGLMLSLARNIPQADASLRRGEWRRRDFMGVELRHKSLGIVGLGKVGSEVARRAAAFQMRILAHDPYVPKEYARSLGVELVTLNELLAESDFITLHTPLTASAKNLLGQEQLQQAKQGVRLINAARGGLIDEAALAEALRSGHVAGAALDVFSAEPPAGLELLELPNVVATPHLGASTVEAQAGVALEVAEQVLTTLEGRPAPYTVNAPSVPAEVREALAPCFPVASILGKLAIQLVEGQIESINLLFSGEIAHYDTSLLNAAALVGILQSSAEERVNLVNASIIAKQRGLHVTEQKDTSADHYTSLVTVEVYTNQGTARLSGTSVREEVHLVRVNDYSLDMEPAGPYLLFMEHVDRPGIIGRVGTIAGERDINISFMEVGRLTPRGRATMVLGLDDPLPDEVLAEIRALPHVTSVKLVQV